MFIATQKMIINTTAADADMRMTRWWLKATDDTTFQTDEPLSKTNYDALWFTVQFIPGTFSTFSEMVRECFVLICETQSSEMCTSWRCRTATHCCISHDSDSWTLTSALLPKLPTTSKNTSGSNTTSVENQQNEITGRWGHFLYRVNWGASHPLAFHMDKTSPQISFRLTKVWLKWRIFLGEIK